MRDFFPRLPWTMRISPGSRSRSVGTGPWHMIVKPLLETKR